MLDPLSAQVAKLSISKPIMNVYEVLQSNYYTPNYRCPDSAARTSNGSILIESYTDNKWRYDLVKPYWD